MLCASQSLQRGKMAEPRPICPFLLVPNSMWLALRRQIWIREATVERCCTLLIIEAPGTGTQHNLGREIKEDLLEEEVFSLRPKTLQRLSMPRRDPVQRNEGEITYVSRGNQSFHFDPSVALSLLGTFSLHPPAPSPTPPSSSQLSHSQSPALFAVGLSRNIVALAGTVGYSSTLSGTSPLEGLTFFPFCFLFPR